MTSPTAPSDLPPGLFRRLIAIFYDGFLLLAVLFCASLPPVLYHGEALTVEQPFLYLLYWVYLLAVAFLFFGWFWTHGGQTLGMRAWRLRLTKSDGGPVGWRHALRRFLAALVSWAVLGLGFWWILFDPRKRAWHDIWSGTRLEHLPRG